MLKEITKFFTYKENKPDRILDVKGRHEQQEKADEGAS